MKMKMIALAWMLILSFLVSMTLADEQDGYEPSANGLQPVPGILKAPNDCPAGTKFFKNQFPSLTNGSIAGLKQETYLIANDPVVMHVQWFVDNSFQYHLENGLVHIMGVTVDTNNILYDSTAAPVAGDAQLNTLLEGIAQDVNHLDFCLQWLDTLSPDVQIVSPLDGDTVSGTIIVEATVTDNVEVGSVIAEVGGVSLGTPAVSGHQYTWSWDTTLFENGLYTLTVTAADTTGNTELASILVTVVTALPSCLEGPDLVPTGVPSEGGCDITGFLQLEYPNDAGQAGNLIVTQAAIPAKSTVVPTASCRTDLYPLIAHDPRVSLDGKTVIANQTLDLSALFDIEGHYAAFHPGEVVPDVIHRAENVGSPCLALIHQDAPEFADLTDYLPGGGVYTVTQFPKEVPGMYDTVARITAPLNYCDTASADCDSLPTCLDDPLVKCRQDNPEFVEQASMQPDDRTLLIKPYASQFTYDVFNASRTKGFKGTFFSLNTREVCLDLDPALVPGTTAYLDAVYQCKIDLALEYADDVRVAIEQADAEGNLISPSANTLYNWLNRARGQIKNAHFDRCIRYIDRFEDEVVGGEWIVDDRNDPGRLLTYGRNIRWRCEQLLLDEAN